MSEVRLIDANALRYKNLAEVNGRLTYVLTAEEINNAPTVKAFTVDEVEEIRQATIEQVRISCKQNERPKGDIFPINQEENCNIVCDFIRDITGVDIRKEKKHERPQGDLISRSEAEKLGATCLAKRNENGQLEAIISLDNAPKVEPKLSDEQIEKIADLLETEWGYEGIREDVSRILRGAEE